MSRGRERLRRVRARLWQALVTVTVLASLALAGRGSLYCHMAGQVMTSCCCAASHTAGAIDVEPSRCDDADAVTRPCCEARGGEALPPAAVELAELVLAPVRSWWALAPPSFPPATVWGPERLQQPAPVSTAPARAGPTRRGKRRARLGVTIC